MRGGGEIEAEGRNGSAGPDGDMTLRMSRRPSHGAGASLLGLRQRQPAQRPDSPTTTKAAIANEHDE